MKEKSQHNIQHNLQHNIFFTAMQTCYIFTKEKKIGMRLYVK